jgi:hypothetical protein
MSAFEEGGHVSDLLSSVGSAIENGRLRYSPSPSKPKPCTVVGSETCGVRDLLNTPNPKGKIKFASIFESVSRH